MSVRSETPDPRSAVPAIKSVYPPILTFRRASERPGHVVVLVRSDAGVVVQVVAACVERMSAGGDATVSTFAGGRTAGALDRAWHAVHPARDAEPPARRRSGRAPFVTMMQAAGIATTAPSPGGVTGRSEALTARLSALDCSQAFRPRRFISDYGPRGWRWRNSCGVSLRHRLKALSKAAGSE